ncbi:hypothetical protein BDZ89DRAFT_1069383 [Hymenopellis radicata]|nr:hypothetical protein BDZ89DRAFT_1069383 [Hymenopellis radicata]
MDWQDYLHWSFSGAHVLFPALNLNSFPSFLAGALLSVGVCLTERLVSFASDNGWCPHFVGHGRWQYALWRASLYWVVTLLRLLYMLIAMSFHVGLILIAVTTLAFTQFIIEYQHPPNYQSLEKDSESYGLEQPLLSQSSTETPQVSTRPRSRSKPDHIFIHPNNSNLARADAAAYQMGLGGNTDRVQGQTYAKEAAAWEVGKGKEGARALMGHTRRGALRQSSYEAASDSDSDA